MTPTIETQRTTNHFSERCACRGLRTEVRDFILAYGVEYHATGANHLTVLDTHLPKDVRGCETAHHAKDWILVLSDDGVLMTCYRRPHATRFLRTKPKRRLSPQQVRELRAHRQGGRMALAA